MSIKLWHYLNLETIFINTENIKTNESNKFIYQFTDKLNIKTSTKILDWLIWVSTTRGETLSLHTKTVSLKYLLPLGMMNLIWLMISYFIYDIRDCFEIIIKKHETLTENLPIQIYPNKFKNRIVKTGYKLELLSLETMKWLRSTKTDVDKDKDGEYLPKLESVEIVSVHCNLVNNNNQQASKVLFTFVPNKNCGQLITISPHSLTMLKTTNAEFQSIQVWFTDQNNRPLGIEDSVNITLMIG